MASPSPHQHAGEPVAQGKPVGDALSVSPPAAAYVISYLHSEGKAGSAIRVAAVRTHCMGGRGFGYSIGEDTERPNDVVVESDGVKLLVDMESMKYLGGAQIDYERSLQGEGLTVRNPNAVAKCHCGRHDIFDSQGTAEAGGC